MKIALYINSFGGGGAERVVSRLSHILTRHGEDVFIIISDTSVMTYDYSGQLIDLGITTASGFKRIPAIWKRYRAVKKLKKKNSFDCVISFLEGANLINAMTKVPGVESLVSIRNFQSEQFRDDKSQMKLLSRIYKNADYVIACSKVIAADAVENFGAPADKVGVLYNPYDTEQIRQLAGQENHPEVEAFAKKFDFTFVTTGRFSYQKGYNHLLRIIHGLRVKGVNAGLVIIGDGPDRAKLEVLIRQLRMEDFVYLAGFQKNPYSFEKYADAYIMTSLFEGFPNALAEAMIVGLPIISADCKSGPREILAPDISLADQIDNPMQRYGIILPALSGSGSWSVTLEDEEQSWVSALMNISESQLASYKPKSLERGAYFSEARCYDELCRLIKFAKRF